MANPICFRNSAIDYFSELNHFCAGVIQKSLYNIANKDPKDEYSFAYETLSLEATQMRQAWDILTEEYPKMSAEVLSNGTHENISYFINKFENKLHDVQDIANDIFFENSKDIIDIVDRELARLKILQEKLRYRNS